MNVPPVSVERVQKCVVNFERYRFLKKAANLPHPPLLFISSNAYMTRDPSGESETVPRPSSSDR